MRWVLKAGVANGSDARLSDVHFSCEGADSCSVGPHQHDDILSAQRGMSGPVAGVPGAGIRKGCVVVGHGEAHLHVGPGLHELVSNLDGGVRARLVGKRDLQCVPPLIDAVDV